MRLCIVDETDQGTNPHQYSSLGWPLDDLTLEWHRGVRRLSLRSEGYRRETGTGWPREAVGRHD